MLNVIDRASLPGPTAERAAITLDSLYTRSWEFGPSDWSSILGVLRFVPCGRIFGYDHPNERQWSFDGVLRIFSDEDVCTAKFDRAERIDGVLSMHSSLRLGDRERCFSLRQHDALERCDQGLEGMFVKERLVDLRRPLLILFNSGANPYAGRSVTWEYFPTTADPSVDFLRIAERVEPASWYLKTAEKIKARIRAASLGRRKVVLAGASSGGYAAIRYGEWLSEQGFVEEVQTISVNGQTVHSLPHRQFLWTRRWDRFLPPSIDDETLEFLDMNDVDLDGVIGRCRKSAVRHSLYFDSGNPVERFHSSRLERRPNVELNPIHLGMPHAAGIQEMERMGVMHSAITAALAN